LIRSGTGLQSASSCFFTPHANEIQRADQFAQVNCIPIVELDGSAKKSDSPKSAGVLHEPSSAVREMSGYGTAEVEVRAGLTVAKHQFRL
jgi:hypothetical protein